MTVRCFLAALLWSGAAAPATPPALPLTHGVASLHAVRFEANVRVQMRDGTSLAADVFRPDAAGKFPALLSRTPYLRDNPRDAQDGKWWASRGYVYISQDVRGRGASEGTFYPIVHEAADGYDTQEWIARQPWANGKVGTVGASYLAWTQLYTAGLKGSRVAAMVPIVAPADPYMNLPLQRGVVVPVMAIWLARIGGRATGSWSDQATLDALKTLPVIQLDSALMHLDSGTPVELPAWRDWMAHPTYDEYWKSQGYQRSYRESTVPALHISGWYDDVLVGTTTNFISMTHRAEKQVHAGRQVPPPHWLVIGPWGHDVNASRKLQGIDFGDEALIDLKALQLRWFDYWLRDIDTGLLGEKRVRIFVMGTNAWRAEEEWPLARTRYVKYYLHRDGHANTSAGTGELSTTPPGREPPDRYTYDPADPVPFIIDMKTLQLGGPDDYRHIEKRQDVLVYTSAPFAEPLEICGPLQVRLFAATSARDTDWTAKILDVHPDGYAQRLNDGIVRARFRHTASEEHLLTPGKVERYDIDAWSTCIVLGRGHRLRLEISSSAFPKFDRNLNTGGPLGRETAGIVARQTIFHDATHASYVLIPAIPPALQ